MREAGAEHHAAGRRPVRGPGRGGAAFQIQLLGCELQVLGFRRKSTFALEGSIAETTAHMLKKCSEATKVPHSDQVSPRSARHPSWWRPEGSPRRWSVWGGVLAVGRVPVSLLYHPTHCFEPRHFKRPTNTLHTSTHLHTSALKATLKHYQNARENSAKHNYEYPTHDDSALEAPRTPPRYFKPGCRSCAALGPKFDASRFFGAR